MLRDLVRSSAVAAVLLCAVGGSAAADEKEFILALDPAFGFVVDGDRHAWGGGTGLDLSYGVTDALAVRATGAFTAHNLPATKDLVGGLLTAWHAGVGITYAVDATRLVPYFDLAVGLLGRTEPVKGGGNKAGYDFGAEIGIGVDYLITRRWAVGFVVRYHAYLTNITQLPVYLYAGPRIAIHFGG